MLSKGFYESRQGDEHTSHCGGRIEQVEEDLTKSEVISAGVPGLRETYVRGFLILVDITNRLYAVFKGLRGNFRTQKSEPQRWSNSARST